jgi:hypothetical protein
LTKREISGKIDKLSGRAEPHDGKIPRALKKSEKNFEKSLKKVLTNRNECGIILKLSRKRQ